MNIYNTSSFLNLSSSGSGNQTPNPPPHFASSYVADFVCVSKFPRLKTLSSVSPLVSTIGCPAAGAAGVGDVKAFGAAAGLLAAAGVTVVAAPMLPSWTADSREVAALGGVTAAGGTLGMPAAGGTLGAVTAAGGGACASSGYWCQYYLVEF